MNGKPWRPLRLALLALVVAGIAPAARALDPTQPPAALRAAPAPALDGAASAPLPARPRLQGLRVGSDPSALINGQLLRPGQRWQGHTLLRVEVDGVVLRDPEGRSLRLRLLTTPSPAMLPPSGVRP